MVDTQSKVSNHLTRSNMPRRRHQHIREFQVKVVTEKGYSVAEAARSLDIGEPLLRS
jgi:hypothetical protein